MKDGLRKLVLGIAALALLLLLTSCRVEVNGGLGPKGSGIEATSKRRTSAFDRVELRGAADVSIVVGKARSVTVRGDDNLLGRVKTKVEGDTLVISTRSYRSDLGISVEIGVPALSGIELSGSGEIDVNRLSAASFSADLTGSGDIRVDGRADRLRLELSGSGDVRLDGITASDVRLAINGSGDIRAGGTTDSVEVEIPGSGDADLSGLSARDAQVDISGSGGVSLDASNSLKASIDGSGDVSYAGNPRHVTKSVRGSGTISAR